MDEGSDPQVMQLSNLSPNQQMLQDRLGSILLGNLGTGVESYPGPLWTGASDLQSGSFEAAKKALEGVPEVQDAFTTSLTSLLQPAGGQEAMDWWQKSVRDPAMLEWKETIAPDIMEKFAAYDALGSGGARKALADAGANLDVNMAKTMADAMRGDKETLLKAAGLGMTYPTTAASLSASLGGTERQIETERLNEPYQKWLFEQPYNNPWLQYMMPYLQQQEFQNMVIPGESGGGGLSSAMGIMGGMGSLLGGIGSFF